MALRGPLDATRLRSVFYADNGWGIAALLSISTGLWRAFGGLEKGSAYYLQNHLFLAKLGLYAAVFLLELWPMTTLIRWRQRLKRGQEIDTSRAGAFATISRIEAALLIVMVLLAVSMARGFGAAR
jgi:putative membrane protein